jgi:periplasmic protein TonB
VRPLARSLAAAALLALTVPLLAAGRPSLNAYFQTTLKDEAYQKKTFDRVAKTWKTPAAKAFPKVGAKTVVQAVITKAGKLASASVSMSSGSKSWDAAALAAVRAAAPFDPLPAGYAHQSLEVHFHVSVVP